MAVREHGKILSGERVRRNVVVSRPQMGEMEKRCAQMGVSFSEWVRMQMDWELRFRGNSFLPLPPENWSVDAATAVGNTARVDRIKVAQ